MITRYNFRIPTIILAFSLASATSAQRTASNSFLVTLSGNTPAVVSDDAARGGGTPPNDLCSSVTPSALAVGGNVVFTGNSSGALNNDGLGEPAVWHAFTITQCANVSVAYCGTTGVWQSVFTALFIGCPYTTYVDASNFNQSACPDGNATINFLYLAPGTYYVAVPAVTGSIGPYTVTVSANACPAGYCPAGSAECDEYIASVLFGSIDNATGCVAGGAVNYTDLTTVVYRGGSVPIQVQNGLSFYPEDQVTVWVDWNQNESFYDAGETYELDTMGLGQMFFGAIAVPMDALLGTTRMRIRMMYTGSPNPCGTLEYGEVEDYGVIVDVGSTGMGEVGQLAVEVFPNPGNGDFVLRCNDAPGAVRLEVLDMTGRLLHEDQQQWRGPAAHELRLSGQLAQGTYLLRVLSSSGGHEQRIVVY